MAKHLFEKGKSGNPGGRPKQSKQLEDFKLSCTRLLPVGMIEIEKLIRARKTPASVKVRIMEMMSDRVYGRPHQALTGAQGGPIVVSFTEILTAIDGSKVERMPAAAEA